MSKELKRRPSGHDYRAELEQRFRGAHLCHMDSIGGSSSDRKPYQVAERIAIIDIVGVLCNDAWYYDETEYSQIQREVRMASEDQDADGILLRICSPGGETDNAFETAAVLSQCAEKKPMWAVADNMAYSAAFLMASTAAKIYVPPRDRRRRFGRSLCRPCRHVGASGKSWREGHIYLGRQRESGRKPLRATLGVCAQADAGGG
jgi:hypothetical protein